MYFGVHMRKNPAHSRTDIVTHVRCGEQTPDVVIIINMIYDRRAHVGIDEVGTRSIAAHG